MVGVTRRSRVVLQVRKGRQSSESNNATATTRSTPTLKPGEPTPTPKIGDPVPTLAGTPPAIYLPNPQGTLVPHEAINPPLTPPVLTSYLKKKIEKREATQEARRSTGDQAHVENEIIWIIISVDSDKRVDEVLKYLEKKSLPIVGTEKPILHPPIGHRHRPDLISQRNQRTGRRRTH